MELTRLRGSERRRLAPVKKNQSFEATLRSALSGDSAAFEAIYDTYAGRILAFATARGTSDPEAVTNDVMLRAFRNLANFSGDEAAFVRWIFTIARNRLIDAFRATERRPSTVAGDVPETSLPSAEDVVMDRLSMADVVDRLAVLTVEQREVILLRLIEDLSLRDVAEITERPVTAVQALQRRGLKALRRHISSEGVT